MKTLITTIIFFCYTNILFGQSIKSGEYEFGLKLAFNRNTKKLTGYYENYYGWDEEGNNPKFSCVFYIEGYVFKNKFGVLTYYPEYKLNDTISGQIEIVSEKTIKIKLPREHGGCWNVEHFADIPVSFDIKKETEWIKIKYVVKDKTHFYAEKSELKKQKAYLVKNNFVCIYKTEGEWAYCTFFGKKITNGWLKLVNLNSK